MVAVGNIESGNIIRHTFKRDEIYDFGKEIGFLKLQLQQIDIKAFCIPNAIEETIYESLKKISTVGNCYQFEMLYHFFF
jgi:hypothetical protein